MSSVPIGWLSLFRYGAIAGTRKGVCTVIGHFTVVFSVTWPLNGTEAEGDLVLIQTSLLLLCKLSCSYAN